MELRTISLEQLRWECARPPDSGFIKSVGEKQRFPIVVKVIETDLFEVEDGARRCEALKLSGKETALALVRNDDGDPSALIVVLAQLHRSSNPVAEAQALQELAKLTGKDEKGLAETLGLRLDLVKRRLALLRKVRPELLEKVAQGQMPVSAAKAAMRLSQEIQDELIGREKVTLTDVQGLGRAMRLELLDLDGISVPKEHNYAALASQLQVAASGLAGDDKQALLVAARVLERLAQKVAG